MKYCVATPSTLVVIAFFLLCISLSVSVADQPGEEANPLSQPDPPPITDTIVRPKLLRNAQPVYPKAAWEADKEAEVTVLLTVDATGQVSEVALTEQVGDGFDEAALAAAHRLKFSPATVNGVPVAVQIRFAFRFVKPEKNPQAAVPKPESPKATSEDKRKPVTIRGTVFQRGKGKILANVEVYILDQDRVVLTDGKGQFEVQGAPGAYAFIIRPPGFYPYKATETVRAGETVKVEYYIRQQRGARYQTIVWGSEGRAEVGRTSLVDDEIRTIAGTMGDPIRVASLLPGASSSVSGLGYPVVRGSLPGDSLYEIDGIRIPMLYHLLFGPAVVHPRFVDEVIFQAGGYSAKYGRFPGARIGATTAKVDEDPVWVADLSIVETSLFRSQKLGDNGEAVAAFRYGTLGYIVEGLATDTIFSYWDYQTRVGYRLPNNGKLTLTLLGASDTAGEKRSSWQEEDVQEDVIEIGFHTADLRYQHGFGSSWIKLGTQLTQEFFRPSDIGDNMLETDTGQQSIRGYWEGGTVFDDLEVSIGGDALYQNFGINLQDERFELADTGLTIGAWTALEWKFGDFVVNPSIRFDHYKYKGHFGASWKEYAIDPRLSASFKLHNRVLLKASVGIHTGPTRFSFAEPPIVFGPIPGFGGIGLQYGLQSTKQVQFGIESKLSDDVELNVTGYYNKNEIPVDFSLINKDFNLGAMPCRDTSDFTSPFDIKGKSYGVELLLRRRLGNSVYGWASYAVSRAERDVPRVGSIPFDFDQKHVFNGVLNWEVGRNWTLGGVFHYNSGRPYTPQTVARCGPNDELEIRDGAPNSARLPNYWRIDVRIEKREVFDTWYFDFYIDFFNAAFQFETIGYEIDFLSGEKRPETVPLFVPMIGIRGVF